MEVQTTFEWDYSKKNADLPDFEWLNFSPGKVGDIIWVRETFCNDERGSESGEDDCFYYKADMAYDIWLGCWKPSLFMPKKACRLFLEVVSVSVERLKDIDEQGAINEGIEDMLLNVDTPANAFRNYMTTRKELEKDHWSHVANDAVESYMTLWQKINGKDSWDLNPFVWVYKFRSIPLPTDFC